MTKEERHDLNQIIDSLSELQADAASTTSSVYRRGAVVANVPYRLLEVIRDLKALAEAEVGAKVNE